MSGKTLHLSFRSSAQITADHGDKFVISKNLDNSDDDWSVRFATLDISDDSVFSYADFWQHLIVPHKGNLLVYAELYSQLSSYIEKENITHIVSYDLEKGYQLVTEDLVDEYGITSEHKQTKHENWLPTGMILCQLSVVFLFVDQILSLAKEKLFATSSLIQDEHLFFPYPDRYDSMLPVIREMEQPFNIVVTPLTISWRLLNPVSDWPGRDKTKTLTEFVDPSTIRKELWTLFGLQRDLLTGNLELSQNLDEKLRAEYGVQLSQTIEYVCQNVLAHDIRLILSLHLVESAIEQTEPSSVIVGSMNPRDRYALNAGERAGADLYYIPHSIALKNETLPRMTETTHFVAGQADEQMLRETYPEEILPNIVPTGRPYFDNLTSKSEAETGLKEPSRVILGTQPYPNWIRKRFIVDVLQALDQIQYTGKVIIKIHPAESTAYYSKAVSQSSHNFQVSVEDGDIVEYIDSSSILLTINSNVGIEGILLGAFCISYNPFEPIVKPTSYISGRNIPYLTTINDLRSHLRNVLQKQKPDVQSQIEDIQRLYSIGNSPERIAEQIEQSGQHKVDNICT